MCAPLLLVLVACVLSVRAEGSCPSCEREHEEGELLEAVKLHILSRLQLDARPNITQTLPRAALVTALRRLHAGRVRQDGRVELPTESRVHEDSSEIISFAEKDEMVTSKSGLFFLISNEGHQSLFVSQASLWLYFRLLPPPPDLRRKTRKVLVKVYFQAPGFGSEWSLVEKHLDLKRSGWHTFDLTGAVRAVFQKGHRRQNLDVRCDGCDSENVLPVLLDPNDDSHRPFLVVHAKQIENKHKIRKRGLECDGSSSLCCRQQFYIDFRLIGWNDWIIAPSGYFGNYCEGNCPAYMSGIPSSVSSFHTAVVNQYRIRGMSPGGVSSCCIPTRLSTMSMLYFDDEYNIVKRDVPNMIVEECGCA